METLAILFALPRSNYKKLDNLEVYDLKRNALTFNGGMRIIAHPPCRFWCKLWYLSKPEKNEYELALWAYDMVCEHGGILEHPHNSGLFKYVNEKPFILDQGWFGHKMKKRTGLIVKKTELNPLPLHLETPGEYKYIQMVSKQQAMGTPIEFAKYLVDSIRSN